MLSLNINLFLPKVGAFELQGKPSMAKVIVSQILYFRCLYKPSCIGYVFGVEKKKKEERKNENRKVRSVREKNQNTK